MFVVFNAKKIVFHLALISYCIYLGPGCPVFRWIEPVLYLFIYLIFVTGYKTAFTQSYGKARDLLPPNPVQDGTASAEGISVVSR